LFTRIYHLIMHLKNECLLPRLCVLCLFMFIFFRWHTCSLIARSLLQKWILVKCQIYLKDKSMAFCCSMIVCVKFTYSDLYLQLRVVFIVIFTGIYESWIFIHIFYGKYNMKQQSMVVFLLDHMRLDFSIALFHMQLFEYL